MRTLYCAAILAAATSLGTTAHSQAQEFPASPDLISSLRFPDLFLSFNDDVLRNNGLYVVRISSISAPAPSSGSQSPTLTLDCLRTLRHREKIT